MEIKTSRGKGCLRACYSKDISNCHFCFYKNPKESREAGKLHSAITQKASGTPGLEAVGMKKL